MRLGRCGVARDHKVREDKTQRRQQRAEANDQTLRVSAGRDEFEIDYAREKIAIENAKLFAFVRHPVFACSSRIV